MRLLILLWLLAVPAHAQFGRTQAFRGAAIPATAAATACSLTNAIAAYIPFDSNANDLIWTNGLGLVSSPGFTAYPDYVGMVGPAMSTDAGGYAQAASTNILKLGGDNSFSISVWVKPTGSTDLKCIIDKGGFDLTTDTYLLYNMGTAFRFAVCNGTTSVYVTDTNSASVSPVSGTWYHLACVYDASAHRISLTVNNRTNMTVAWANGTYANTSKMTVGSASAGGFYWNGWIDEMVFWTNRALTTVEVSNIYVASVHGLTPFNYCSSAAGRSIAYFNGDARFTVTGANTNLPNWMQTMALFNSYGITSWMSNHNAILINNSGGVPPPTPPNVEQLEDLTNNVMFTDVTSHVGPNTNVYWITEIGINDFFIMAGVPLYGYGTAASYATILTNYCARLTTAGVKTVVLTAYDLVGLHNTPGDGTLANAELVRLDYNQRITNANPVNIAAFLDVDPWLKTNNVPMWWGPDVSELNDRGNTNVAIHLNALLKAVFP